METVKGAFKYPVIILFFAILAALSVADMMTPTKAVSELENRPLTQAPAFSATALFNNEWTYQYGEYTRDQFIGRDSWISAQSGLEIALGKLEANGVWYAKDGYQIAKVATGARSLTELNTGCVTDFAGRFPGQVRVMVVPSASNILSDRLRWDPPRVDENAQLDSIFAQVAAAGGSAIDLRESFATADAAGNQLYYRTDHHWTTTGGARLAYEAFCESVGRAAVLPDESLLVEVPGFLGTNFAKTKRPGTPGEPLEYYDLPNPMTIHTQTGTGVETTETGIMDKAKLDAYDKYAAFLHGNNGYSVIEGNGTGSVLVIKDSYGNCFVPYLVENYAKVGVIDLRTWDKVDSIIESEGYEDILVLYSFDSFSSDQNIIDLDGSMQKNYEAMS